MSHHCRKCPSQSHLVLHVRLPSTTKHLEWRLSSASEGNLWIWFTKRMCQHDRPSGQFWKQPLALGKLERDFQRIDWCTGRSECRIWRISAIESPTICCFFEWEHSESCAPIPVPWWVWLQSCWGDWCLCYLVVGTLCHPLRNQSEVVTFWSWISLTCRWDSGLSQSSHWDLLWPISSISMSDPLCLVQVFRFSTCSFEEIQSGAHVSNIWLGVAIQLFALWIPYECFEPHCAFWERPVQFDWPMFSTVRSHPLVFDRSDHVWQFPCRIEWSTAVAFLPTRQCVIIILFLLKKFWMLFFFSIFVSRMTDKEGQYIETNVRRNTVCKALFRRITYLLCICLLLFLWGTHSLAQDGLLLMLVRRHL